MPSPHRRLPRAERARRATGACAAALGAALLSLATAGCGASSSGVTAAPTDASVARQWNEELLEAIRDDFARPTVHARNLFQISAAMWDAWAAYDEVAQPLIHFERADAGDVAAARREAISYAAHRMLAARFAGSPGADATLARIDSRMTRLGYDPGFTDTAGGSPAALGNRVAAAVLAFGASDGSNEANGFANRTYRPVNPPLFPTLPGNPDIVDPNRWQPLALEVFEDQSGNILPQRSPPFLSPEWGMVTPFSLTEADRSTYPAPGAPAGFEWVTYHDPGPPPRLGGDGDARYRDGFVQVVEYSSTLTPDDGVSIDVSPASLGDNSLGSNDGDGYERNPVTGQPYTPQIVPRGDYTRVLAEFWADGPDSETPPGHWFTILNQVSDHPELDKRIGGTGPVVDDLEWDVKAYLALGGAMHDVAVAAWGVKGYYDFVRPISAIRYLAGRGQSSDPDAPSYDPRGIPLVDGLIEVVTPESSAPGQRHAALAEHVGEIALHAWLGPERIDDPTTQHAGVGWMLASRWWPYQRPSFVTPPFAGYVSGHSTFSRAAAELLTRLTGSEYFPGGLGAFPAPAGEFLVFEKGPSVDVTLEWARYRDAADECSLSRIYGGIHPTADDIPGRFMGAVIGPQAWERAVALFEGRAG